MSYVLDYKYERLCSEDIGTLYRGVERVLLRSSRKLRDGAKEQILWLLLRCNIIGGEFSNLCSVPINMMCEHCILDCGGPIRCRLRGTDALKKRVLGKTKIAILYELYIKYGGTERKYKEYMVEGLL